MEIEVMKEKMKKTVTTYTEYEAVDGAEFRDSAECEKYEAYINEKLLLSVDVTPKEYKNGADYYVRLSYQDDEYPVRTPPPRTTR